MYQHAYVSFRKELKSYCKLKKNTRKRKIKERNLIEWQRKVFFYALKQYPVERYYTIYTSLSLFDIEPMGSKPGDCNKRQFHKIFRIENNGTYVKLWRCGGSLLALQTYEAVVPSSKQGELVAFWQKSTLSEFKNLV